MLLFNHVDTHVMEFSKKKKIVLHWFQNELSNAERKTFLDELGHLYLSHQLQQNGNLEQKKAVIQGDFMKNLPRSACILILSYLDPRSLSRCSQVCWHWNFLASTENIWKEKCLSLGWDSSFAKEVTSVWTWKALYIKKASDFMDQVRSESARHIDFSAFTDPNQESLVIEEDEEGEESIPAGNIKWSTAKQDNVVHFAPAGVAGNLKQPRSATTKKQLQNNLAKSHSSFQPWRASSRHPNDIKRFNYFDNPDKVVAARSKRYDDFIAKKEVTLSYDTNSKPQPVQPPQTFIRNVENYGNRLVKKESDVVENEEIRHKKKEREVASAKTTKSKPRPASAEAVGAALPPWLQMS